MSFTSAGMAVDRGSDRPLYVQVREAIHHQIRGHTLLPGQALPSEAELQRIFGVARSVVRQAVAGLVDLGVVERTQGRVTIVAPRQTWRRHVQRAGGLVEQYAARGQTLDTQLLSFQPGLAPPDAEMELGTRETWQIERRRSVNDVPVAFVRTWVARDLFPDLNAADFARGASLHALMRAAGSAPYGGRRYVQAVPADEYLAAELLVGIGDPLLLLAGTTRDAYGRGLEWFNVWHRGDTVFDVDATVQPEVPSADPDLAELRDTARLLSEQVAKLNDRLGELSSDHGHAHAPPRIHESAEQLGSVVTRSP